MRKALFLSLALMLGLHALSSQAAKINWSKKLDMKALTTAEGPMTFKEIDKKDPNWPGTASIEPIAVIPHTRIWIYKNLDFFTLDISLDSKGVLGQTQILPTDKKGLALKATNEIGPPWIKVKTEGYPLQVIDAVCVDKRKSCDAQWRKFPYDPNKETVLEFETNIRGFENLKWKVQFNRFVPHAFIEEGKKEHPIEKWSAVHDSPFMKPKLQGFERKLIFSQNDFDPKIIESGKKVIQEEEWILGKSSKLSGTGFYKTEKYEVIRVVEGKALVLAMVDSSLQTLELSAGQEIVISSQTPLSVQSKLTKGNPVTRVRRFVFD